MEAEAMAHTKIKGKFVPVPPWWSAALLEAKHPKSLHVAEVMAAFRNFTTGEYALGLAFVAKKLRMTERSVRRHLCELRRVGIVEAQPRVWRRKASGYGTETTVYQLVFTGPDALTFNRTTEPFQEDSPGPFNRTVDDLLKPSSYHEADQSETSTEGNDEIFHGLTGAPLEIAAGAARTLIAEQDPEVLREVVAAEWALYSHIKNPGGYVLSAFRNGRSPLPFGRRERPEPQYRKLTGTDEPPQEPTPEYVRAWSRASTNALAEGRSREFRRRYPTPEAWLKDNRDFETAAKA
jgi:hypothetical protein